MERHAVHADRIVILEQKNSLGAYPGTIPQSLVPQSSALSIEL
jgi:hypothetical protein